MKLEIEIIPGNQDSVTVKGKTIIIDLRYFEQFVQYGMGGRRIYTLAKIKTETGEIYDIDFREKSDNIQIFFQDSIEKDFADLKKETGVEIDIFNSSVDELSDKLKKPKKEIRSMLYSAANN